MSSRTTRSSNLSAQHYLQVGSSILATFDSSGRVGELCPLLTDLLDLSPDEQQALLERYSLRDDTQLLDLGLGPEVERAFSGAPLVFEAPRYDLARTLEDLGCAPGDPRSTPQRFCLLPVSDESGTVERVLLLSNTVGLHQGRTRDLQEYLDILETSPAVAFLWANTPGWPVEKVTRNVAGLFGVEAEEFLSRRVSYDSFIHPDDLARVTREVEGFSAEEGRRHFSHEPYRIVRPTGEIRWVDDRTVIRRDASGAITHYQGILLDVTARREAEENHEWTASVLETVEEMVRVGGWEVQADGQTLRWTHGTFDVHGYSRDERPRLEEALALYEPEAQRMLEAAIQRALEAGEPWDLRARLTTRDGRRVHTRSLGRRHSQVGGAQTLRGAIQDITDEVRREEEALRVQRIETMAQLAAGLAHDFNNHLGFAVASCELLRDQLGADHPAQELITGILRSSENASNLTGQMLSYGRNLPPTTSVLALPEDLHPGLAMIQRIVGERIHVVVEAPEVRCGVRIDLRQLERCLLNLATNARDAMPEGGTLTLRVSPEGVADEGGWCRIEVADTGQGMSQEVLARSQEPFFTTKEIGKGTGLGLSSVREIVDQSGGHLEIETAPGAGTTVRLALPLIPPPPSQSPSTSPKSAPVELGRLRILLVDDEEGLRAVGERLLSSQGFEVHSCATGEEALQIFGDSPGAFDLLYSDVVLPGMSGPALALALRRLRPDLAVVLASGYAEDALSPDTTSPRTRFLQKPVRMRTLRRVIAELQVAETDQR